MAKNKKTPEDQILRLKKMLEMEKYRNEQLKEELKQKDKEILRMKGVKID